jgi:enoyl-CoA hydratase/carnithine racemase
VGELVQVEIDQAVATIRLNRPPMNALGAELQDQLAGAAAQVGADPAVRAVVIYGGERLFAAGADIKEMSEASYAQMGRYSKRLQDSFTAVARISKPVIAAVTGYALGGGLELALCADFRVLGESAKVGQPEILLGLIPGAGGTQRLPRLIGPAKAKDLIFTGRFADAAEALAIGLADKVVPDDQVYPAACEMASGYANGPAIAIAAAKRAIDAGLDCDLDTGLEFERISFAGMFGTDDAKAGIRSFLENGPGKAVFSAS